MDSRIIYLFLKYLNNECSPEELQEVMVILQDGTYSAEWEAALNEDAELLLNENKESDLSSQEINTIYDRIEQDILSVPAEEENVRPATKVISLWLRYGAAAMVLLALSAGLLLYLHKRPQVQLAKRQPNDLGPGGNKAVLTLASGQKIILNTAKNGVIATQGNMAISNQTGQLVYNNSNTSPAGTDLANVYDTLTTPRGGMYHLTLSDGSTMWLNATTSVRYPAGFSGKYRDVELIYGEAYFEVRRNDRMPFRVLNDGQITEDLATHFNINAYKDEPSVNTTLLEGSIKVSRNAKAVILKPGQQAIVSIGSPAILLREADAEQVMAWKNGLFSYSSTPLETVMRQIARWYDADIVYQTPDLKEKTFSGSLSRYDNVSRMLRSIEFAGSVKFKVEGRKITVLPQ